MSEREEFKHTFFIGGSPRTVNILESSGLVVVPKSNELARTLSVRIDNQWINYLYSEMLFLDMPNAQLAERFGEWYTKERLRLLLARDAVNMFLRKKESAFTNAGQPKTLYLTGNNVVNFLNQEKKIALPADEAKIIELFLIGFEHEVRLTASNLYISTDFSLKEIEHRLQFYLKREFIIQTAQGEYSIKDSSHYDALESRLDRLQKHYSNATGSERLGKIFRYLNPIKPQTSQPIAFVGLPFRFGDHYTAIEQACASNGYLAYKIDRDPRFDTFLNKVLGAIMASRVCIFDVTDFNANVMLELGVAMSTNLEIIVVADEEKYLAEQGKWQSELKSAVSSENIQRLESYLEDTKFINLVPSDVRERSVHLFKSPDELKIKLSNALAQIT